MSSRCEASDIENVWDEDTDIGTYLLRFFAFAVQKRPWLLSLPPIRISRIPYCTVCRISCQSASRITQRAQASLWALKISNHPDIAGEMCRVRRAEQSKNCCASRRQNIFHIRIPTSLTIPILRPHVLVFPGSMMLAASTPSPSTNFRVGEGTLQISIGAVVV